MFWKETPLTKGISSREKSLGVKLLDKWLRETKPSCWKALKTIWEQKKVFSLTMFLFLF